MVRLGALEIVSQAFVHKVECTCMAIGLPAASETSSETPTVLQVKERMVGKGDSRNYLRTLRRIRNLGNSGVEGLDLCKKKKIEF